jgi:hypothetical protein
MDENLIPNGDVLYRPHVPAVVKRPAKRAWRALALQTAGLRSLPGVLIIGAQRGGTTSLYSHLVRHPLVARALDKEVHYFDRYRHESLDWYRSHFPTRAYLTLLSQFRRSDAIACEATPDYLFVPSVPELAAKVFLQDQKFIVLLRDPITRAYSAYMKEVGQGTEVKSFTEVIRLEPERLGDDLGRLASGELDYSYPVDRQSYLARGLYATQLRRWFQWFDRKNFLVLRSEDFFTRPDIVMLSVYDFLGLPRIGPANVAPRNVQVYPPISPETYELLVEYFAKEVDDLADLLGRRFDWFTR